VNSGRAMALDATFLGLAEFSVFYVTSVIHEFAGMSGTLLIGAILSCISFIGALTVIVVVVVVVVVVG
jgi:hypothetical protein